MSDLKNRIFGVVSQRRVAGLATVTEDGKPWVRYVVPQADRDLTITFSTFLDSRKVAQVRKNPEVHLTTGVASLETARQYVQIQGLAGIVTEKEALRAYWHDHLKVYFSGPDDPNYCLIEIRPYRIELVSMTGGDPEVWTSS